MTNWSFNLLKVEILLLPHVTTNLVPHLETQTTRVTANLSNKPEDPVKVVDGSESTDSSDRADHGCDSTRGGVDGNDASLTPSSRNHSGDAAAQPVPLSTGNGSQIIEVPQTATSGNPVESHTPTAGGNSCKIPKDSTNLPKPKTSQAYKREQKKLKARKLYFKPEAKHNVHTYFPADYDNCEICRMTKPRRQSILGRETGPPDALPKPLKWADAFTADHKILDEEDASRESDRNALIIYDRYTHWLQCCLVMHKSAHESMLCFQAIAGPQCKPQIVYTDSSRELEKSLHELGWPHDTSTKHRPQTNGVAERAVQRVKQCAGGNSRQPHSPVGVRHSSPGSTKNRFRGKSPSGRDNAPLCHFFLNGRCQKGDKCDYFHQKSLQTFVVRQMYKRERTPILS